MKNLVLRSGQGRFDQAGVEHACADHAAAGDVAHLDQGVASARVQRLAGGLHLDAALARQDAHLVAAAHQKRGLQLALLQQLAGTQAAARAHAGQRLDLRDSVGHGADIAALQLHVLAADRAAGRYGLGSHQHLGAELCAQRQLAAGAVGGALRGEAQPAHEAQVQRLELPAAGAAAGRGRALPAGQQLDGQLRVDEAVALCLFEQGLPREVEQRRFDGLGRRWRGSRRSAGLRERAGSDEISKGAQKHEH